MQPWSHGVRLCSFAPAKCFLPLCPMSARLYPHPGLTLTRPYGGTAVERLREPPVLRLIPYPPPKLSFSNEVFMAWIKRPRPGLVKKFF